MATALVMGVMIGSGVFLLPAQLAPYGWNGVVGWAVSIGGALMLALVIARLTRAFPDVGGPTGFVDAAFGAAPAFLIGWSYWIGVWVSVVTVAVAAVSYLSLFMPVIGTTPFLPAALSIALLWIVTLINLRGARSSGAFQIITMAIKLIPMVMVLAILAVLIGASGTRVVAPLPAAGLSLGAVTAATTLTLWAMTGFESASIAAARVERPEINIPRATLIGTLLTGIIYLLVCSGIALTLPVAVASASDAPFATFVAFFWAREPASLIALFAAVAAIGSMSGSVLLQGEMPVLMAKQHTLPQWFGKTNASGTPTRAIILSSIIATLFVVFNSSKSMAALFTYLALLATSATLWLYLGCALAALRLGIAVPYALIGAVFSLWALWGAGIDISALSFVLMIAGLPFYVYARREEAAARIADETAVA